MSLSGLDTVNPLYNDIRYNSKIRYNVNLVCTKISGSCIFSLIFPCYSSGKQTFCVFLESPHRGDSNKYSKRMIYNKKKCSKVAVICALDGKFLYNSKIDFTAKSLVKKQCRYSEGPLYKNNSRGLECFSGALNVSAAWSTLYK